MASTSATVAREAPVATNCDICIEKFNKTTQKQIKCPYCAYTSCSACTRQYLLQSKDDAHCMSCRRLWGRDILIDMFPMSFLNNDYKKHREEILFDQEKSLLPEAQPRVQQLRTLRVLEIEQSKLREIYNQKATEILEIKIKMDENFRLQRVYKSPNSLNLFHTKRAFIRSCPADNCRGFLGTNWECGTCNTFACNKCHEVIGKSKDVPHTCNPDNVESAKVIMAQSRPCPKCASLISKIDGCDQMWCTQCHTAFSWKTGLVCAGRVHNPHFYEWQRGTGREIAREQGDIPCGGFPDIYQLRRWFKIPLDYRPRANTGRAAFGLDIPPEYDTLLLIHRIVGHMEHAEMPHYQPVGILETNEDLRVRFLMDELTEDNFKLLLQQREKRRKKKQAIFMVLEMFVQASMDIFRNALHDEFSKERAQDAMKECDALRTYVNEQLKRVSALYVCRVPQITQNWQSGRAGL